MSTTKEYKQLVEEVSDECHNEKDSLFYQTETDSCMTYYSATLQAPRNAAQYCPSCNEKAEYRLCSKCRDSYICVYCAPNGVCKSCIITCVICLVTRSRGDFLTCVCDECEEQISELNGEIIDEEGLPHRNLIELMNANLSGKITTDEILSEELCEYLNDQGILVDDASLIS